MRTEYKFRIEEEPTYRFNAEGDQTHPFTPTSPINITGTSDYNDLENKPSINGHVLEGDQSSEDLGINIPTRLSQLINDANYAKKSDIPKDISQLTNDAHFITAEDIPPIVTDLGSIDSSLYDDDISTFFNTLTESGWYRLFWDNGDDYSYFVQVQSIDYEDTIFVNQHCWGLEESPVTEWIRGFIVEDGEVVDEQTTTYMSFETANNIFASKSHTHYRTDAKALSVWDYCDGSQIKMQSDSPILYTDTLNGRQYIIETWLSIRQPTYNFQKITDLIDGSAFYQRSGFYQADRTNWGNWYKFTGEIYTP